MRTVKEKSLIASVFLAAFLVRLAYIIAFKEHILTFQARVFGDTQQYILMAENLLLGKGLMISPALLAYRPPLYPIFLAGIYYLFGNGYWPVRVVQIILGSLSSIMIYILGRSIFNAKVGILASFISVLYPFFIYYTGFELTETLFIFLLILVILYLVKAAENPHPKNFVLAGILLGLASLCKPTMLAFVLLAIGGLLFIHQQKGRILPGLVGLLLLFAITVAPWTIRNYLVLHKFIPGTTMGGLVLYAGNNPLNKSGGGIEGVDYILPKEVNALDESERDEFLYHKAIEYIKAYPGNFLKLAVIKFSRVWRLYPYAPQFSASKYNIVSLLSYGLILPFSIAGMILSLRKWKKCLFLYLVILYFTFFHMVSIGSVRYRAPIMPYIIIFAGYGLQELGKKLGIRRFRIGGR